MNNYEKFKTAKEREIAFGEWCKRQLHDCPRGIKCLSCMFEWLDLEAEYEKPLPCPFCGGVTHVYDFRKVGHSTKFICDKCGMELALNFDMCDSVVRYNRVARAVMEAKESEEE